jgi:hypothetical protein
MPLPQTLNTNEVKIAAGTELEFGFYNEVGRMREYAASGEAPNLPHRLKVSHQEVGKGLDLVRRSVARVDKTITGASGAKRVISFYKVAVIPQGDIADYTAVKDASAELASFCSLTGADSTLKYDGTGTGDSALINGTL